MLNIALNGENYTFNFGSSESEDEDAEEIWTYEDEEIDFSGVREALENVTAEEFTEEIPSGQREISLTVHLANEDFPTYTPAIYRYDGSDCIAVVNGEPTALVSRSLTIEPVEEVNALILGK